MTSFEVNQNHASPSSMEAQPFEGQVAIVTGAGAGIGAAIARRLVTEGVRVALADINLEGAETVAQEIRQTGGDAMAAWVNVTDPGAVNSMVETVANAYGRIDILVNNAGIIGPTGPIADYPTAEWRHVLAIDLDGTFYCTRAVVPHMLRRGYGRIVNMSSISGKEGNAGMPAYAAAKSGVLGLTKAVGRELARSGILVNAVTPAGVLNTGISDRGQYGLDGEPLAHTREAFVAKTPLGRLAEPEEIAELVAWVASPRCSFTAGGVFDVSGGRAQY